MVKSIFMRTKWYPRPHEMRHAWGHSLEVASQYSTIYPLVMYDEGKGDPSGYNANPEHASFAVATEPNCYPESRVNRIFAELTFNMTKGAIQTDNLEAIRIGFQPIFMSFETDYDAKDELTGTDTEGLMMMQHETTDRQGYPLYNGTKLTEKWTNSALLDSDVPGLTTTQVMEGTDFNINNFYNSLQYYTNGGKVKRIQGGIKWITLYRDRPTRRIKIKLRNKNKRMNPYSFMGVNIIAPQVNSAQQYAPASETTAITHFWVQAKTRYDEWNQDFDFGRV